MLAEPERSSAASCLARTSANIARQRIIPARTMSSRLPARRSATALLAGQEASLPAQAIPLSRTAYSPGPNQPGASRGDPASVAMRLTSSKPAPQIYYITSFPHLTTAPSSLSSRLAHKSHAPPPMLLGAIWPSNSRMKLTEQNSR